MLLNHVKYAVIGLIFACGICGHAAEPQILIGEHYGVVLNGLTFIKPKQAGFMVRIGWIKPDGTYQNDKIWTSGTVRHGVSAPDYSINDLDWMVGDAKIRMMWGKTSDESAVCVVTSDKPIRIALEATPAWQTYPSTYSILPNNEIVGRGQFCLPAIGDSEKWTEWKLRASGEPIAKVAVSDQTYLGQLAAQGKSIEHPNARHAALVYDLTPEKPLRFAAGFGSLDNLNEVEPILKKTFDAYDETRVRAFGDWGKFIDPMIDQMGHCRLYDFQTHWVAPAVCRFWRSDDGVMYFVWDSFFNAQIYCLEDLEQAKIQLRALFLQQQENGLLPLYSGARWDVSWDRSQPPVGAMCLWKIYQRWPDKELLAEFYPNLKRWHDWWFAKRPSNGLPYRDGNRNGLLEWGSEIEGQWQHAVWESGLDDSPMYDEAVMKGNYLALDDVGLNSLYSNDAKFLAMIADELGKKDDAAMYRKENKEMNQRMNTLLWNKDKGIYCNRYWSLEDRLDYNTGHVIPDTLLRTPNDQAGVKAEYFNDGEYTDLVVTRNEKNIDYHCGPDLSDTSIGRGKYWGRWTANLTPEKSGDYTFTIASNGASRLYIDGEMVLDAWNKGGHFIESSSPVSLKTGKAVEVKLEHTRDWRDQVKLTWFEGDKPPTKSIFSDTLSPMCFYPMIAGAPSDAQAKKMMDILTDPDKFWGQWMMPTVPRDDPAFPDEHYWRGKIWPPSNYLVYQGLKEYADDDIRGKFARKSITLFMRNYEKNWSCHENFTNDGNGSSVPYYTWGALMPLIGLEELCDVEPDGTIRLNATLSEDIKMRGVPINGKRYDIEIKDGKGRITLDGKIVMQTETVKKNKLN